MVLRRSLLVAAGFWISILLPALLAQAQQAPPQLPAGAADWINGGPVALENLKGKAAVIFFFEETCPNTRDEWPTLLAMAKKYEQKPVLFIGVNSGNPREPLAKYLQDMKVTWPVICDSTRKFEQDALGKEINLQNIKQFQLIMPDGSMEYGDWMNPEASVTKALEKAAWPTEPTGVPDQLFPLWKALEFGLSPGPAGSLLKPALNSADPTVKAAADSINTRIQAKIATDMQTAKAAFAAGEKWKSYKLVDSISVSYTGIDLPESVGKAKTALAADEAVKKELTAQRELDSLKKRARTATPVAMRGLIQKLKEIPTTYAGTDAAAEAEQLIASIPAGN